MPDFIDILPQLVIVSMISFLLILLYIRDRFRSPYRATFYLKTSGRKVTCNLSNVETSNNGHTISWESPSNWGQTMGNITPEEVAAIKVRDRRMSFCL